MRINAVLLTLVQLAVWGFYAPTHRLIHHTHLTKPQPAGGEKCHTHCCHHHPPVSCTTSESPSGPSDGGCPDDDQNCDLCQLAIQSASQSETLQLSVTLERVEPLVVHVESLLLHRPIRAFDCRGPPSA
ncbi:MAG: hypothetical protein U0941_15070 [Planctomycetaceae bacterium]